MARDVRQATIPITRLRRQLGQVMNQVARSDVHLVIERYGIPVAVMLSMAEYERLVGARRPKE